MPRFACLLAISYKAFLRPGEYLFARRSALQFPADALAMRADWMIWRHASPKTRRSAARVQPSRLDDPELINLARALFYKFEPDSPL